MIEANDANFEQEVLRAPGTVLVDFFTPSCAPCQALEPHLRALDQQLGNRLKIVRVNAHSAPQFAGHSRVQTAPTLIIFKNGQAIQTIAGAPPPQRLRQFVMENL